MEWSGGDLTHQSSALNEELTTDQPPISQLNVSHTVNPPAPLHSPFPLSPGPSPPTLVVKPRTVLSTTSSRSASHVAVPPAQPSSSYHAQQIQALSNMLEAQQQAKASPGLQVCHVYACLSTAMVTLLWHKNKIILVVVLLMDWS